MEHHPYFRTNLHRYHSSEALTVSPLPLLVVVVAPLVSGEVQEEVVLLVLGNVVPLGSRKGSGVAVLRQEGDHVVS
ncbi:hypothetical protein PC128_g15205 [Phytophthora cactorum]|nr:hypothetical protein PC120_g9883 [Phytophthora cactorum]KAG3181345.1 hypothetical protein PC128_g15205 [Phytophthora cactorum]